MSPSGLILAVGLSLTVAQTCDVSGFTLNDFSDAVTVTNASTSQTAFVGVTTSQAQARWVLKPGASRTLTVIAAPKYTVLVMTITSDGRLMGLTDAEYYQRSLTELRSDLEGLLVDPGTSAVTPEEVLTELASVQNALDQVGSGGPPTCSHAIVTGGDNHATLTWATPASLSGLWELSCT